MFILAILGLIIGGWLLWTFIISLPVITFWISVAVQTIIWFAVHPLTEATRPDETPTRFNTVIGDITAAFIGGVGVYLMHGAAYFSPYWTEVHAVTNWVVLCILVKTLLLVLYHGAIQRFNADAESVKPQKRYKKSKRKTQVS